jgi:hypothetical protein
MNFIVSKSGRPVLFITNEDIIQTGTKIESNMKDLLADFEGKSLTVDVSSIENLPVSMAIMLVGMSRSLSARGAQIGVRATERTARALKDTGFSEYFSEVEGAL